MIEPQERKVPGTAVDIKSYRMHFVFSLSQASEGYQRVQHRVLASKEFTIYLEKDDVFQIIRTKHSIKCVRVCKNM